MDRVETSVRAAIAAVAVALLAGCGGGHSSGGTAAAAGAASGPVIQAVSGVSTPDSVSVVTATNAQ